MANGYSNNGGWNNQLESTNFPTELDAIPIMDLVEPLLVEPIEMSGLQEESFMIPDEEQSITLQLGNSKQSSLFNDYNYPKTNNFNGTQFTDSCFGLIGMHDQNHITSQFNSDDHQCSEEATTQLLTQNGQLPLTNCGNWGTDNIPGLSPLSDDSDDRYREQAAMGCFNTIQKVAPNSLLNSWSCNPTSQFLGAAFHDMAPSATSTASRNGTCAQQTSPPLHISTDARASDLSNRFYQLNTFSRSSSESSSVSSPTQKTQQKRRIRHPKAFYDAMTEEELQSRRIINNNTVSVDYRKRQKDNKLSLTESLRMEENSNISLNKNVENITNAKITMVHTIITAIKADPMKSKAMIRKSGGFEQFWRIVKTIINQDELQELRTLLKE